MFPVGHRRRNGLHEKTRFRIEIAIRLAMTNLGMTDTQIASHLGLTSCSYTRLKSTSLYKQLRSQAETGVISAADAGMYANYSYLRKKLEVGVPVALENLLAAAAQKIDKKLQMDASKEILDRHGLFSKVARIGLPTQAQGGVASDKDNELAMEILKSVAAQKQAEQNIISSAEQPPASINDAPITELKQ